MSTDAERAFDRHEKEHDPIEGYGDEDRFCTSETCFLAGWHAGRASRNAEVETLRAEVAKVLEGFDLGFFVRNTKDDGRSDWAVRFFPYAVALGKLADRARPKREESD